MRKVYVCNRYPNLMLSYKDGMLQFKNGILVCEDEEQIAHVESLPSFGVFIVPQELESEDGPPNETSEDRGGDTSSPRIPLSKIGTMRKDELVEVAKQLNLELPQTASRSDLILAITAALKANGGHGG